MRQLRSVGGFDLVGAGLAIELGQFVRNVANRLQLRTRRPIGPAGAVAVRAFAHRDRGRRLNVRSHREGGGRVGQNLALRRANAVIEIKIGGFRNTAMDEYDDNLRQLEHIRELFELISMKVRQTTT